MKLANRTFVENAVAVAVVFAVLLIAAAAMHWLAAPPAATLRDFDSRFSTVESRLRKLNNLGPAPPQLQPPPQQAPPKPLPAALVAAAAEEGASTFHPVPLGIVIDNVEWSRTTQAGDHFGFRASFRIRNTRAERATLDTKIEYCSDDDYVLFDSPQRVILEPGQELVVSHDEGWVPYLLGGQARKVEVSVEELHG